MNETGVTVEQCSAGVLISMVAIFLQDAVQTTLPRLFTMLAVILCDSAFGVRKSLKLGIHISLSCAIRATMSKMVTYVAWVMTVVMIDYAEGHSSNITTWVCSLVCLMEGMNIIGNMLKPYGYNLSVESCVVFFLSPILRQDKEKFEDPVSDGHLDVTTARERKKWGDVKGKNSASLSK